MEERLTANEFVQKLKDAPEWAMETPLGSLDIKLHVREDGEIKTFLSPDMTEISEVEGKVFLAEVRRLSRDLGMMQRRLF